MTNKNFLPDDLKTFFQFTRKERKAIYWMVGLIVFIRITPIFFSFIMPPSKEKSNEILQTYLSSIRESPEYQKSTGSHIVNQDTTPLSSLFVFDPNLLSTDSLLLLGVGEKATKNWEAYRKKGGKFKKPDEVLKIYGLDSVIFKRLTPFISISSEPVKSVRKIMDADEHIAISTVAPEVLININRADAFQLKKLNGIGNVLSERIIKYRNLLGGYYSIDQLGEVYGITDETLATIRGAVFTDGQVTLIDPSKVLFRDLLRHPYIDYELAQILSNHKKTPQGELDSILRAEITPQEHSRLIPYLYKIN